MATLQYWKIFSKKQIKPRSYAWSCWIMMHQKWRKGCGFKSRGEKWHKPIERLHKICIAPYHNFTTTWLRNFIPSYLTWNRTYLSINFRGFRPGMLPRPYWKEKYQIAPWFSLYKIFIIHQDERPFQNEITVRLTCVW